LIFEDSSYLRPDIHSQINVLLGPREQQQQNYREPTTRTQLPIDRGSNSISYNNGPQAVKAHQTVHHHPQNPNLQTPSSVITDEIRIPLNKVPGRLTINQEIQTDVKFNDTHNNNTNSPNNNNRYVKQDIQPVFAEVETISFYHMTFEERMEHLKMLLNDGVSYKSIKNVYDPCIEYANYSREAEPRATSSDGNKQRSKSATSRGNLTIHKIPIQTYPESPKQQQQRNVPVNVVLPQAASRQQNYTDSPPIPRSPRSPRGPTTTNSTSESTTYHRNPIRSETSDRIDLNITRPRTPPSEYADNNNIGYSRYSEYNRDNRERVTEFDSYTKITRSKSSHGGAADRQLKGTNLAHSTIELTSVMNDKTVVRGIPIKDAPVDAFSIHVRNSKRVDDNYDSNSSSNDTHNTTPPAYKKRNTNSNKNYNGNGSPIDKIKQPCQQIREHVHYLKKQLEHHMKAEDTYRPPNELDEKRYQQQQLNSNSRGFNSTLSSNLNESSESNF
jgi:hypothetical protein